MFRRMLILGIVAVALIVSGCSKEKETAVGNLEPAEYVGSDACRTCHSAIHSAYGLTGHNFILTKIEGSAPVYPDSVPPLPGPPAGYTWDDISYVVGGFGWKALFVDDNGYLITGNSVQYNLRTDEWVDFMSTELPGTVPYDCAGCHSTGYADTGAEHQGNMAGVVGGWAEDGVACERCHGAGGEHALNPADVRMTVNGSSALCGECHSRNGGKAISAEAGLILNYSQYDELSSAGHGNVRCATCHNPHFSTVYDPANAIEIACADCHSVTVSHAGPDDCKLCHMPRSVKSAASSGSGLYLRGDIRSHIFAINTDTTQAQFYIDGGEYYSNGFNGLNFSCLSSCHSSENLGWAAQEAGGIHQ